MWAARAWYSSCAVDATRRARHGGGLDGPQRGAENLGLLSAPTEKKKKRISIDLPEEYT